MSAGHPYREMKLQKLLDRLCAALSGLAALFLALMVVMVFGNVVLRYGFNSGITVSEELSRWLFVWMTFLGATTALHRRTHLGTDMLVARLPLAGRKLCFFLAHLIMLFLSWMMLTGAWEQTRINWTTTSAVMQISVGWFYGIGVVFAVLAIVILLHALWQLVSGTLSPDELVGVRESEEHVPNGSAP